MKIGRFGEGFRFLDSLNRVGGAIPCNQGSVARHLPGRQLADLLEESDGRADVSRLKVADLERHSPRYPDRRGVGRVVLGVAVPRSSDERRHTISPAVAGCGDD